MPSVKLCRFETCQTFRVPIFAVVTKTFGAERAFDAYRLFVKTKVFKLEIVATFRVPTLAVVVRMLVVVRAFDADILPVTVKLVSPGSPVIVTTSKLAVEETFRVVEFTNGIVRVSKLKIVLFVFDENPAATILVVVKVLLTVRFARFETCQTFRVPTLAVVAKTLVAVRAFEAYRLFRRTNEFKFEMVATFRVPTLAVVARRFVVVTAFAA